MRTIGLACLAGFAAAFNADLQEKFVNWATKFNKNYTTFEDFTHRFNNWYKQHELIEEFNSKPNQTATLGHNHLSDWTDEEYKALLTFSPKQLEGRVGETKLLDTSDLPDSINWVELGGVNPVQDQGTCGSCWAFSAVASMEGHHFVNSGELLKLSEQQCVDCDPDSFGCSGGW